MKRIGVLALVVCAVWGGGADGLDYSVTDLVGAARRGDGHAVRRLLELDPELVASTDAADYTALHWAGIRGHWRIFERLIEAGAPVNAVGADGGTPMHWACHHDRADMVRLLLDTGADIGVHNRWGRTPLHVAARRGNAGVATLLLDNGADPNAVTAEGWTPLHVAYRSGHAALVEILLAGGADPQRIDEEGLKPSDGARTRPPATAMESEALDDYVGLYGLGPDATVKVWREDKELYLREFAPDRMYPIGNDRFFCRQEPWRVTFLRDGGGRVTAIQLEFLRRTVRGDRLTRPRYVGSKACRQCHSGGERGGPYVQWLQSRHAHAYWRLGSDWALYLARLRPHYRDLETPISDDRCLLCHTSGAQDPDSLFADGYRVEEGVSCEACHGPGSEYIDPKVMADRGAFLANGGVIPDESTCRSCHRAGDRFDFATWWPKIAHPTPAALSGGH
jgi:hypothetical protein